MNIEQDELWNQLDNETERAFGAFQVYMSLPSRDRTVLRAYRQHVGNASAIKASDTWSRWASQFAWRERAAAYDDYLARKRRKAYERGVEEEAEREGALAERTRGRMFELLTLGYERAMECLEDEDWVSRNLRFSDVLNTTRLHLDALKTLDVDRECKVEDDWEEDGAEIVKETDALPHLEHPDSGLEDKEGSEEGSGEECFSRKAKVKNPSTHQVLEPEARAHLRKKVSLVLSTKLPDLHRLHRVLF
jgi:hypothetical protein